MSRRYTNEEIAEVVDNAHDYMLVHGWTRGTLSNTSGEVCIMGAVWNGTWDHELRYVVTDAIDITLNSRPGVVVCRSGLRTNCVYFNDAQAESVDDVLELLRQTSKRLREVDRVEV